MTEPTNDMPDIETNPAEHSPEVSSSRNGALSADGDKPSNLERIDPLVAEIHARLAEVAARERELKQREWKIQEYQKNIQAQSPAADPKKLSEAQARLRQRAEELKKRTRLVNDRLTQLADIEKGFERRHQEQQSAQAEIEHARKQLKQKAESLNQASQAERDKLRRRIDAVRQQEQELNRRITLAHADITQQREALEKRRNALDRQTGELERHHAELKSRQEKLKQEQESWQAKIADFESRRSELESRRAKLESKQTEFESRRTELDAQATKLANERGNIETQQSLINEHQQRLEAERQALLKDEQQRLKAEREALLKDDKQRLEAEQQALAAQQREFTKNVQSLRQQHDKLKRQSEELDARRRIIQEQHAALEQRQSRLENYDEQLRGRANALEVETEQLANIETELNERRAAADKLFAEARETVSAAEKQAADAASLREEAEARDAETRQMLLSLELEQEELDQQRLALEQAQQELDGQRAAREAEYKDIRARLAEHASQLLHADQAWLGGPQRWWLRAVGVAPLAGVLAAMLWLEWERVLYRATVELKLSGEVADPNAVLATHERHLRSTGLIERIVDDADSATTWRTTLATGAARVARDPERDVLEINVRLADAAAARRLLATICASYDQWVRQRHQVMDPAAELSIKLEQLLAELEILQTKRDEQQAMLAGLTEIVRRDEFRAAVDQARGDFEQAGLSRIEQQEQLNTLLSTPSPTGTVEPAEYQQALTDDEMYLEDISQSRVIAREYRSELAVAMLLVVDPVKDGRRLLDQFSDALSEQRDLQPPPTVAAVLEESTEEVAALARRMAAFADDWHVQLARLRQMNSAEDVVALIKQQAVAAETAGEIGRAARQLVDGLLARFNKMDDQTAGGTREVVVATVLRSELSGLTLVVDKLTEAVDQLDLSNNFQLDALDRQIRGMRRRLEHRESEVRRELQIKADEAARRDRDERIAMLQEALQAHERQRDDLITRYLAHIDELRRLDAEVARRLEIEVAVRDYDKKIAELRQDVAVIERQQSAERSALAATALVAGEVQVQQIAGVHRERNAAYAAAAAFAATFLLCVFMLVKNPLRRPSPWRETAKELTSPASEDTAEDQQSQT
ncbi:MAG: hypothetical protein ABIG44_17050 [Planctomycetota bacterium]